MISRQDVILGMKVLRGEAHGHPTGLYKKLALSLFIYRDREEFDGTITSAIEYLELAGYIVN